jgi:AraC-like DNA-binding protein
MRSILRAPWSLRIRDEAPLSVVVVARGTACVLTDAAPPVHLDVGDVLIAKGPMPYTVADRPDTEPMYFINPGQICTDAAGRSISAEMMLDTRAWGNDPQGSTVLVTGTYEHASAVSEKLLRSLPPLIVLSQHQWNSMLVTLLCDEVQRDELGQDVFLDRLLDLVVMAAVRAWLASAEADRPGWFVANGDPVVGPALRLLHDQVSRPWTVATLANEVGVSRAAFARRFTELLGEPPMAYLTTWRLALAADMLLRTDRTIGSIAGKVGYSTPFALSAAFSRVRGVSPAQYRARTRADQHSARASSITS